VGVSLPFWPKIIQIGSVYPCMVKTAITIFKKLYAIDCTKFDKQKVYAIFDVKRRIK